MRLGHLLVTKLVQDPLGGLGKIGSNEEYLLMYHINDCQQLLIVLANNSIGTLPPSLRDVAAQPTEEERWFRVVTKRKSFVTFLLSSASVDGATTSPKTTMVYS